MMREHSVYGKFMCLDIGDKCIGVALSDEKRVVARAYGDLHNRNGVFDQIYDIVQKENVGTIVVGWPLELSGRAGRQCEKVYSFVSALDARLLSFYEHTEQSTDVTLVADDVRCSSPAIVLIDERYSTRAVMGVMRSAQLNRKKRTVHKDVCAAIYILQIFLDMYGRR